MHALCVNAEVEKQRSERRGRRVEDERGEFRIQGEWKGEQEAEEKTGVEAEEGEERQELGGSET